MLQIYAVSGYNGDQNKVLFDVNKAICFMFLPSAHFSRARKTSLSYCDNSLSKHDVPFNNFEKYLWVVIITFWAIICRQIFERCTICLQKLIAYILNFGRRFYQCYIWGCVLDCFLFLYQPLIDLCFSL